jgi:hypothetical protein
VNQEPKVQQGRTLRWAQVFLDEIKCTIERACYSEQDVMLPRMRAVHERRGHATPEFRTAVIPVAGEAAGQFPELLGRTLAQYARTRPPVALLLAIGLVGIGRNGQPTNLLILEAHDGKGTRRCWKQGYATGSRTVSWDAPELEGWFEPGEDEMILDIAFAAAPDPGVRAGALALDQAGGGAVPQVNELRSVIS